MRNRWVPLMLGVMTVLAACGNRPPAANRTLERTSPHQRHRVVTFNTYMAEARALASYVAATPALRDADVVALQEVVRDPGAARSRACEVAEVAGFHCAYAAGHALANGGDLGVALWTRAPMTDEAILELPYKSTVFRSGRRVALAATSTLGGHAVRVIGVHLDNRISPRERVEQLAPVFAEANASALPVIVAGDLNTSPFRFIGKVVPVPVGGQAPAVTRAAAQHGLIDATAHAGPTSRWFGMQLDRILVRGLHTGAVGTAPGGALSDHVPLWVDVAIATR